MLPASVSKPSSRPLQQRRRQQHRSRLPTRRVLLLLSLPSSSSHSSTHNTTHGRTNHIRLSIPPAPIEYYSNLHAHATPAHSCLSRCPQSSYHAHVRQISPLHASRASHAQCPPAGPFITTFTLTQKERDVACPASCACPVEERGKPEGTGGGGDGEGEGVGIGFYRTHASLPLPSGEEVER